MTKIHHAFHIVIKIFLLSSCAAQSRTEVREDFGTFYNSFEVDGSFVLYDPQEETYTHYKPEWFREPFTPASTFKICNSLIGLETGVIENEDFVIFWDSVVRPVEKWNQNHNLRMAFKNSTVWYYQELSRRVGEERMQDWLDTLQYGNADISGGIDQFWLNGSLKITQEEQLEFLKKLHDNDLPFSLRTMDIVKRIMVVRDTSGYVLRAKTGWAGNETEDFGWYVGYLETKGNVYYFANCIRSSNINNPDFGRARGEIVDAILQELNIIEL